jgi:hypothetical protein
MACTGRFADADEYDTLLGAGIDLDDADQVATVNLFLEIAASDIHAAMAGVGACDCTLEGWAVTYLKKLNILDAAVIHNAPCGNRFSDDQKRTWLEWLDRQFELIRTNKIALCAGDTGSEVPAYGAIEYSHTSWNQAQIIQNELQKRP